MDILIIGCLFSLLLSIKLHRLQLDSSRVGSLYEGAIFFTLLAISFNLLLLGFLLIVLQQKGVDLPQPIAQFPVFSLRA